MRRRKRVMDGVRQNMRKLRTVALPFIAILSGCATEPPRIDSTSEVAFENSFSNVTRSLHGYEPRRFALALFGVLLPSQCLNSEAIIHLTFAPVSPSDGAMLQPCREQLQGKSYVDIIAEGEAKRSKP